MSKENKEEHIIFKYIKENDIENLKLLLSENKIDLNNIKNKDDKNLLTYSHFYHGLEFFEIFKLLIKNKIDINIRNENNESFLMIIIKRYNDCDDKISYLVNNNAFLTTEDIDNIKNYIFSLNEEGLTIFSNNINKDLNLYLKLYDKKQHTLLLNILSSDYYNN